MTDETKPEPGPETTFSPPPLGLLLSAMAGGDSKAFLATAEGVSGVFEATREFVSDNLKPELVDITDPDSGITVLALLDRDGIEAVPDHVFDGARDNPRFRRGEARLTALDSFIAHTNRFSDPDSVVFADDNRSAPSFTTVLDYFRADGPSAREDANPGEREHGEYRHGKHRSGFSFPLSDEWKAWNGANGSVMTMIQFAAFLEKRISDIAIAGDDYPEDVERFVQTRGGPSMIADFATLVELSRGLKVHESSIVEEVQTLNSGEVHMRFTSEHRTSKVGSNDTVKVPTMFFIAIPIFNRGAYYRIPAALNYRKSPEGVVFWFDLHRPDKSFDHAFNEAVEKVKDETGLPVLFGKPE